MHAGTLHAGRRETSGRLGRIAADDVVYANTCYLRMERAGCTARIGASTVCGDWYSLLARGGDGPWHGGIEQHQTAFHPAACPHVDGPE